MKLLLTVILLFTTPIFAQGFPYVNPRSSLPAIPAAIPKPAAKPLADVYGTANGNNSVKFRATVVEQAISQTVAKENIKQTVAEYQKQMNKTTGEISIPGLYKVCNAAGFDVLQTHGFNDCKRFIQFILSKHLKGGGIDKCFGEYNGVILDGKCTGRDGKLAIYARSCLDEGGECIRIFDELQTQTPNGKEFIYEYGKIKGLTFTCANWEAETRRTVGSPLGQDFLRCTAGGKAYEFEFDDLNQDPGEKSAASENKALCETLYGGKIKEYAGRDFEVYCDMPDCKKIMTLASKINRASGGSLSGGCNLKTKVDNESTIFLRTAFGINNKVFYNSKIQSRADQVQKLLEDYLRTHPNTKAEKFIRCDGELKKVNDSKASDQDYYMTCTVGSKQIDFIFDDLSEFFDYEVDAGNSGMNCIISNGTYKGKTCRGLNKIECDPKLNSYLKKQGLKGAYWDNEARACFLRDSVTKHRIEVATNAVVGTVVIVGGTVATIATGGAAAPVLVAGTKMLLVDTAFNIALEYDDRLEDTKAARRFESFISDANKCNNEACALKILTDHHARLSEIRSDLNKDDEIEVQTSLDRLIGFIKTEYVVCGYDDNGNEVMMPESACDAMEKSRLHLTDYVGKVSGQVLVIGAIVYNPGIVTKTFVKLKNVTKLSKTDDVLDATKIKTYEEKLSEAFLSKKYAPGDQRSFDDFKAMFKDEADFDNTIKAWDEGRKIDPNEVRTISKNNLEKQDKRITDYFKTKYPEKQDELHILNKVLNNERLEAYEQQTFKMLNKTIDQDKTLTELVGERIDMTKSDILLNKTSDYSLENMVPYSTWDEEISLASKEFDDKIKEIGEKHTNWENNVVESFRKGNITKEQYDSALKGLNNNKNLDISEVKSEFTIKFKDKIPKEDIEKLMLEREQMYLKNIGENRKLRKMALNYENLSDTKKTDFTQKVMDKTDEQLCLGDECKFKPLKVEDLEENQKNWAGWYGSSKNPDGNSTMKVHIVEERAPNLNTKMKRLIHEEGHRIDNINPNMGILGEQKAAFGKKIYQNTNTASEEVYKAAFTEQSSYGIDKAANNFEDKLVNEYGDIFDKIKYKIKNRKNKKRINNVGNE